DEYLFIVGGAMLVHLLKFVLVHKRFAPHFNSRQFFCPKSKREGANRFEIMCDVISLHSVSSCRTLVKDAIVILHGDRDAVKFQLRNIQRRLCPEYLTYAPVEVIDLLL